MTERMVRNMLVPVSPSGTGKTLMAFTDSACFSSQPAAAANISRIWTPERAWIVTGVACAAPVAAAGPPCRCRIRMLSCVLLHSNNAATRSKGEPDGTMRRLRQGHSLWPQHPAQALGAVGTQGPEDEPHLQGERPEEDVRHRRSVATAERLHALPAHAAQGQRIGTRAAPGPAIQRSLHSTSHPRLRACWL